MTSDRVAVVAVHGIANQLPGQTVRELARLLCHGADRAPRYVHGEIDEVLVPVERLEPGHRQDVSQSARRQPGAPSGFYQAQLEERKRADPEPPDLGMELNDYLLGRMVLPEEDALYESTRISIRRRVNDRAVDIYEMYWADLSRLGAGGLRALWSLYQLFFHLSTLAADLVDQVALCAHGGTGWRLLQRLHAWMAWLMKGPAALLQLAMLLMVVFGSAGLVPSELHRQLLAAAFALGSVVSVALAALTWLRGSGPRRWALPFLLLGAALASMAAALVALTSYEWIHRMYFGAGALAVALLGWYLVDRYSGVAQSVRVLGQLLVLASIVMLCIYGAQLLAGVSTQGEWMITAALNVAEWLLAALLLVWAVFVLVQIVTLLLGWWLGRGGDRAVRASLHTSRMAVIGSSAFFTVLSLVLWSVVSFVGSRAVPKDLFYLPVLFPGTYRAVGFFLEDRLQTLGGFFTPLVLGFTLLMAAVLLVLLPSLLEEISPSRNEHGKDANSDWGQRLGNWLGGGIRFLGTTFTWLMPLGAIAGGLVYLAFVLQQFAFTMGVLQAPVVWAAGLLALFEGQTLVAAGKWLAGGAVTIAALGSRFTQTFGRLRVALDAVLDIDNYFADPPNRQPPRARIYSRYVSLLAYLRERKYSRVVIVAHSQGTVISAELLRYLHKQGRLQRLVGSQPLALVTVGSPLRDLYAERFPLLYQWIGPRDAAFTDATPAAAEVGVTEWVNACRSGDYVGRFIWTPDGDVARFAAAIVDPDGTVQARRAGDRTEFCLGAGGHTRYFSNDAVALAVEIDRLVATPLSRPVAKPGGSGT